MSNKKSTARRSSKLLYFLLIFLLAGAAVMVSIFIVVRDIPQPCAGCPYISTLKFLCAALFLVLITSQVLAFISIIKAKRRENEIFVLNETLLKHVPLAVSVWTEDREIIVTSEHMAEMFGLDNANEYVTRFNELSPERQPCGMLSSEKCIQVIAQAFSEGKCMFKWMHQTLSGEPLPLGVTLVRFTQNGRPLVAGFGKDLRPEMEAQERDIERAASQRLKTMIEALPLGCCITDEQLNVLDCNDAIVTLFGLKDKQEYLDRFNEMSPEFQPGGGRTQEMFREIIAKTMKEGSTQFEWMHQTLDGTPLPVEVNLVRTIIDEQTVIIGYLRDLRVYYEYQKAEREIRERMHVMINTIPLIITYWGQDHSLLAWNQYAIDFYNLDAAVGVVDQAVYQKVREEALDGTDWFERLDEIFEKGSASYIYEDKLFNVWEMEGIRTTFNGENVVVTYGKSVTQLRELEVEQKRRAVAEESNRAKTMFIANMSHEIRTPMNSILGYSELALENAKEQSTREYLNKIITNTKWLLDILSDVLDISKIESGLVELEAIPFCVLSLAERCQSLIMPSVADKNIRLDFNVDANELNGKRLIGDPTKISQICTNILSNAVKFTDRGGAVITNISAKKQEDRYVFSFECKDIGIGMTQDQMSRIFEPFMQADSSTTRKYGGTGLGLTIAKRLVTAMDGELIVESSPGLGSRFSFIISLPAAEVDKTSESGKHKTDEILQRPSFENSEVLVVDDNDMNLGVACEHLRRVGLTPIVATNGKEAISIVKQKIYDGDTPFALILMDIHMAVMDGREAAAIIAELNVGTPIVAMTADTMMPLEESPGDYGMQGYLSKPFTSQQLWRCLLEHLQPIGTHGPSTYSDMGVDEELAIKLKALFVKNNKDVVADIARNIDAGAVKEAHRLAHTLKSSSMLIGQSRLSGIAKEVEGLLSAGVEPPGELLEELENELVQVLDQLKTDGRALHE